MEDRDFKGVWIPKDIWLNKELNALDKVIFAEIDSLDNEEGCWASNQYLAEFCGCSESKITKAVAKLKELGLIEVENFDGRHRIIRVVKFTREGSKIYEAESQNLRTSNIANKQIDKKDIITINSNNIKANSQNFTFGTKQEKPKKETLYSKCVALINGFTDDEILKSLLTEFLKNCIANSKESGTPFYTNTFKGKLNKLKNLSDDNYKQRDIVKQTLDNGWNGFYPLKEYKHNDMEVISSEYGIVNSYKYTDEERKRQEEWRAEMKRNGKRIEF